MPVKVIMVGFPSQKCDLNLILRKSGTVFQNQSEIFLLGFADKPVQLCCGQSLYLGAVRGAEVKRGAVRGAEPKWAIVHSAGK